MTDRYSNDRLLVSRRLLVDLVRSVRIKQRVQYLDLRLTIPVGFHIVLLVVDHLHFHLISQGESHALRLILEWTVKQLGLTKLLGSCRNNFLPVNELHLVRDAEFLFYLFSRVLWHSIIHDFFHQYPSIGFSLSLIEARDFEIANLKDLYVITSQLGLTFAIVQTDFHLECLSWMDHIWKLEEILRSFALDAKEGNINTTKVLLDNDLSLTRFSRRVRGAAGP